MEQSFTSNMHIWKSKYPLLDQSHEADVERLAHRHENSGLLPPEAEAKAYSEYSNNQMIDGAVFHAKAFRKFENERPALASMHKAILFLYASKGIDVRDMLFNFNKKDRQLINPDERTIYHPSDLFVLKYVKV